MNSLQLRDVRAILGSCYSRHGRVWVARDKQGAENVVLLIVNNISSQSVTRPGGPMREKIISRIVAVNGLVKIVGE